MGAPAPVPPVTPRRIAFRQGLLFGGGLGIVALLLNISIILVPFARTYFFSPTFLFSGSSAFIYLLAFVAFFFAGWRATRQTGRVDIGGLAGFWAGLVSGGVVLVIDLVLLVYSLTSSGPAFSRSSLLTLSFTFVFLAGRDAILALLAGTGLGALGGFIGRTYATGGPAAAAQPNQPPASPSQPPSPPQNQP